MAAKTPAMLPSDTSVEEVLDRVEGPRRGEADELVAMMSELTGETPVVWANRIIGFGQYQYLYESGHGGISPLLGFATGSTKHTIYLVRDYEDRWPDLMKRIGKYRASKACLYLTRLSNIDIEVLRELLERSLAETLAGED